MPSIRPRVLLSVLGCAAMHQIALWVVIVASVVLYMLIPSNTTVVSSMQPLGTVVDVKDCNAGKRSLSCAVRTSTHAWNTDVTDWPGDIVQAGDQLAIRTDETEWRRETWVCRNGMCRSQSMCLRWMPCWKN